MTALRVDLLRQIPSVDFLLGTSEFLSLCEEYARGTVRNALRLELDAVRSAVVSGKAETIPSASKLADQVRARLSRRAEKRVINASGVVLHTNLGRARLCESAVRAAACAASQYTALEYDLRTGKRSRRGVEAEAILCRLTGAESALIVNNNAAAVLLLLCSLAAGWSVAVSRGELVEIGGSFRIPEILAQSGSVLYEVGTTNRTRLSDYEKAASEGAAALLKVHTSNYRIVGFTEEVSVQELSQLGKKYGIPVIYDLGSGALFPLPGTEEPDVSTALREGADLVSFSGDKLLGGPQAGIVVGKASLLDPVRRHPLMRALRADKMTLAALTATLQEYEDGTQNETIPVLSDLLRSSEELYARAVDLCAQINTEVPGCAEPVELESAAGGGSLPEFPLHGWGAAVDPSPLTEDEMEEGLRSGVIPIVARIWRGRVVFDVRTVDPLDFPQIAGEVARLRKGCV